MADPPLTPAGPARRHLRRRHRLSGRSAFTAVFREGRRLPGRLLVVYVRPAPGPDSRLGLSAGRKLGPATRRNALKRRLREAFRLLRPELPRPLDVVVVPLPEALGQKTQALAEDLRRQIGRAGRRGREEP